MWPFSQKKIDAPQIDIDGSKLKEHLRETYQEARGIPSLPPLDEDQVKAYFSKWMKQLPDDFRRALLDNDGKGRAEVWIFEESMIYSGGLSNKQFLYAANLFASSLKRCLGLNAKVNVAGATRSIELKTKELKKFFETPDIEIEKQLHQMGPYR